MSFPFYLPLAAKPLSEQFAMPATNPVLVFALIMLVVLIAPLMMRRLRLPEVIGLILAGIAIGPNSLHVLERGEAIVLLGQAGLLYIMFLAGIEIDLNLFRKYRTHSLVFGCITFLIPQGVGTAVAYYVLGFGGWASILLASMFASHTLLSYPIASRLGLGTNKAVTAAVGGTIITDTVALLVLVLVASTTRGEMSAMFWATLALSLTIYSAAVWYGLPWLGRMFFRYVPAEGTVHFVFIMAAVYVCAFLAEVAGVEAIIGAFLAGLALNRLVPNQSVMMTRLEFAGSWFFIPVFLISVGMLVNPEVLISDANTWRVGGAMTGIVIATKLLAAFVSGRFLGYTRDEGWVMFGLSINQAAATLAAVIVGYEQLGIFDESVLNGTIMMILVTCIIGPWVTQRFGRRLALAQSQSLERRPLSEHRILIPLQNPRAADAIMDVSFLIREKTSIQPVYPLMVVQDPDANSSALASAEDLLGHAAKHAAAADVPVTPTIRVDANAAEGMMRAIRELRISTVVMGWAGSGATRNLIFGTVLDQLLRVCPQQLLVCRFVNPPNAHKRLVFLVPPLASREPGFAQAVSMVKQLAGRIGLPMVLTAERRDVAPLSAILARVKPDVPLTTLPVDTVDQWLNPNGIPLAEGDLFVMLTARAHQVSYRPTLDRLPRLLTARPVAVGMIAVYPAEETGEQVYDV